MCPGIAVLGGGGAGGDGDGDGSGGKDGAGGDGKGKGDGAAGDGKKGGCAEGDPICPITGRMFVTIFDFGYGGPLPLRWVRHYDSRGSNCDGELGFGWSSSFGWRIIVRRSEVHVIDDRARRQIFDRVPGPGEVATHPLGWALRRAGDGWALDVPDDGLTYGFGPELPLQGGPSGARRTHALETVTDANGNRIILQRDPRGVLNGIVDAAGRPYRVSVDERGRLLEISVATEASHQRWLTVVRYTYDGEGNLASATDAGGYVARYAYDGHLMTEHRSVSGLSYCYRYDGSSAEAYCVETWGEFIGEVDPALDVPLPVRPPDGRPDRRAKKGIHHRRMTYDKPGRYSEAENGLGGFTRYFGDALGRAVKIVDANGGVTERSFDPERGSVVAESVPGGHGRSVRYDGAGAALGPVDAQGRGRTRHREPDGTLVDRDDWTGAETARRLDERGNLRFIRHADGTVEEWEVDERGLWTRHIARDGSVTSYEHDAMGNAVRVVNPGGRVEASTFDYRGRRIAHVDWAGRRTEWSWDDRNEIIEKRHADGTVLTIEYDANRKPTRVSEAGRVTQHAYGGIGWLYRTVDAAGRVTERRYDTEGNLVRITNPRGQEFTIRRDYAGNAREWTTFEGVLQASSFDNAGNRTSLSGPTGKATFAYDAEGQLTTAALPDGDAIAFERPDPEHFSIDDGTVRLEEERDALGRVILDKQGPHTIHVTWKGGKVAEIQPEAGAAVRFGYGQQGDLETIQSAGATVRRVGDSAKEVVKYLGDKLLLRQQLGPTGLLARQSLSKIDPTLPVEVVGTAADPNLIFWASYEHDAQDNLRREYRADGSATDYDVTVTGEVTERRVWRGQKLEAREQLDYDAAGTPRVPGATYDAQMRPTALGAERFEYDDPGRLVRRRTPGGDWEYRYNALDQLVGVVAPTHRVDMIYDALGRRVRKRVFEPGVGGALRADTSYAWTNNTLLVEKNELDGSTRTYLRPNNEWDPEGHVDQHGGSARACYYVKQPNGALDFAVDETGKVVWSATSTIFGDRTAQVADVAVSLRMSNQHDDPDVGLIYNRHRWYDPRVGLFVTPDPLLVDGNQNPRDYVSNPYKYCDPLGQNPPNPFDATECAKPGKYATDGTSGVPGYAPCPQNALNKGSNFGKDNAPASAQGIVNRAGNAYGCHGCGTKISGYGEKDEVQHWTCDHQPPRCTYSDKTATKSGDSSAKAAASPSNVRLYPHCKNCSSNQGQTLGAMMSKGGAQMRQDAVDFGKRQMAAQQKP
jgi:RHS repeat-associated protein